ncbi:MAG: tetratricopeptide repeat protein [Cyanobacteria bacterium TGS_CYA1]|nr:tetratricopeptide repeat protein [Cyanobacteria bacterium TGS_CYA1]
MKEQDDLRQRIIQDGPGNRPIIMIIGVLVAFLVVAYVSASIMWAYFDGQAFGLFSSAEKDMAEGRYSEAKEKGAKAAASMTTALMFNKFVKGKSHAEVANDTLNLARCYDVSQDFQKSEDLHQQACELFLKAKGDSDYEYGWSLLSFGDHYKAMHNRGKALEYYNKALPIIEKTRGTAGNDYKWTIQRIEQAKQLN